MKKFIIAAAMMPLSACAMSGGQLARSGVDAQWTTQREPMDVAFCLNAKLRGGAKVERLSDGFAVVRKNGYGVPVSRWDILNDGSVTFRNSLPVNSGKGETENCL